ncbi:MAG TPA: NAD(P)-dependent alcohol dehydrogenase [Rhizomicrobium sp.]|jgi:NADPH:quinone reductase-like Zn-dependent oxidoreductase|nr:NAD(P)-dependent alcohol dehydrogenase [Rhizomicrobium sp.]
MKAVVSPRYGTPDVLEIREVPKPVPSERQVLVAVHAAAVGRTDCGMLAPHPFILGRLIGGLFRPQPILGMDFAGVVEAVGSGVTKFKPGDHVFGMLGLRELGAHAEYLCESEDRYIATMPEGLPFTQAVVGEGAFYAQGCLSKLNFRPGDRLLIYGASGAIGTAALQLAKAAGARVTAVVGTRHVELMQSLGAERVIDYTREDFTRIGETFDGVLDAVGKTTYLRCRRLLKPNAMFVGTDMGPYGQTLLLTMWKALTGRGRVTVPMPRPIPGFIDMLKARMEAGEFRAVIDRRYSLEAIADAYRYVETGQKTGIVVVNVR